MLKGASITVAAGALAIALSGSPALADACSGHSHAAGSVLGAVGGGVIGSALTHGSAVGVIGGAVAGGFAGNAVARNIDCDRGRHYDHRVGAYYYYDRDGNRVYEDGGRYYEGRYYYRRHHRDYDDRDEDRRYNDDYR